MSAEITDAAWTCLARERANEMVARILERSGPGEPYPYVSALPDGYVVWPGRKIELPFVTSRILFARCDAGKLVRSTVFQGGGMDSAAGTLPDGRRWVYSRHHSSENGTLRIMEEPNAQPAT